MPSHFNGFKSVNAPNQSERGIFSISHVIEVNTFSFSHKSNTFSFLVTYSSIFLKSGALMQR